VNRTERFAVIERYLAALRQLGNMRVDGAPLRDALRQGALDLWMASNTRESSLWNDDTLPDQIRMLMNGDMQGGETAPRRESTLSGFVSGSRTAAAWLRALAHSIRPTVACSTDADVVFVQYWPTPPAGAATPSGASWRSAYFGDLSEQLVASGVSVGFLHLHADGPVTKPPRVVRDGVRCVSSSRVRHVLVADALSLRAWWGAIRNWVITARRLPTERELSSQIASGSDLERLWPWWDKSLRRSVRGSHGVRAAMLTEMFGSIVRANTSTKLWVVAFEGQGWESCLARQLDSEGRRWLPYVHTMMRPWDLRARTFLSEYPVTQLAIHGRHDRLELEALGTPMIDVEALRYQHLAATNQSGDDAMRSSGESTWLIVGGGDCERSHAELEALLEVIRRRGVTKRLVARWHPQCAVPKGENVSTVQFTTNPLHELVRHASAAIMVGRAAPLDTYLAGVPSCYLLGDSGLKMSPIDENTGHHAAQSAEDAIDWMLSAEQQRGFVAPVSEYFVIDAQLPRWMSLVKKLIS